MITIGIIAILLAIMGPVLRSTMGYARGFRCKMALRNIAFDFRIFADDRFYATRGDDTSLPGQQFRLETFLNAEYGIDEFWAYGGSSDSSGDSSGGGNSVGGVGNGIVGGIVGGGNGAAGASGASGGRGGEGARRIALSDTPAFEMLQCPEVHSEVTLHAGASCSSGGVLPGAALSYGFNRNLHETQIIDSRGRPRVVSVQLSGGALLSQTGVPLGLDVDAPAAAARGVSPFYTAPDLSAPKSEKGGKRWFPALRHNGQANVSFIDGHVATTADPIGPSDWRWDYQPAQ